MISAVAASARSPASQSIDWSSNVIGLPCCDALIEQLGRHGGEAPAMKEVHEEGFENVFAVMAEHQGRAPLLPRDAVEMPPPQPRAQRAIGAALRQLVGHHRIGVLVFDAMLNAI